MAEIQNPEIPGQGTKAERHLEAVSRLRDRIIRPFLKRGQLLLAAAVLTTACAQAEKETGVTVTPLTPTSTLATQTIEGGLPSTQTPIIETPTVKPPSTESPEVSPSTHWELVVAPELDIRSAYPFNRTTEQDIAIIQSTIDTLPQIGNLKIVLTSGKGARFDKDYQTINVGRDSFPESMKAALTHDYFHFLDPLYNSQALREIVGPENFDELIALRNQALEDPNFSPNVPSLDKIFAPKKRSLSWDFQKNYTPDQLAPLGSV